MKCFFDLTIKALFLHFVKYSFKFSITYILLLSKINLSWLELENNWLNTFIILYEANIILMFKLNCDISLQNKGARFPLWVAVDLPDYFRIKT